MKQLIRPDIDYTRCNAYSATGYMYAAISVNNRPVFATIHEGETNQETPDDMKGGIIVFPQESNCMLLSADKLTDWIRQRFPASSDNNSGLSDADKDAQEQTSAGWAVGKFFKGRYTGIEGTVYSEDSLSLEITGVSDDELVKTGEELCRAFDQAPVLIKTYPERNRIFVVSAD
ncbi:hypothetical protein [Butyrivibrio sp. AE2032]|uniref:hypothetical protein n=1 Tax=Butyrivibrio sp. AE2032 TaxID=1458463 RepID=UPI00054EB601|nr:hypothetical protein [Butyrivibrio sp. AE2032]